MAKTTKVKAKNVRSTRKTVREGKLEDYFPSIEPLPNDAMLKVGPNATESVYNLFPDPIDDGIISEAAKLVFGEKAKEYGPGIDTHERIAKIANAIKDIDDANVYTADKIAMILQALKLARMQGPGPFKRDSYVDLIGYTHFRYIIKEAREKK